MLWVQIDAEAAEAVLRQFCASGYSWFRLHPKGRGVVVCRPGGLPPFTLVEEYFGQLHSGACSVVARRGSWCCLRVGDINSTTRPSNTQRTLNLLNRPTLLY